MGLRPGRAAWAGGRARARRADPVLVGVNRRRALLAALPMLVLLPAPPAAAATGPLITGLSAHHGAYWGGSSLTIRGSGFTQVQQVRFGTAWAPVLRVDADSSITV